MSKIASPKTRAAALVRYSLRKAPGAGIHPASHVYRDYHDYDDDYDYDYYDYYHHHNHYYDYRHDYDYDYYCYYYYS